MNADVDPALNQVQALDQLRAELIAAAKEGDIKEVGRITGALNAVREAMRLSAVDHGVGPLILSAEQRRVAGILVVEALRSKIPTANFSVVVSPEANCAGSPVVVVTLPTLRADQAD